MIELADTQLIEIGKWACGHLNSFVIALLMGTSFYVGYLCSEGGISRMFGKEPKKDKYVRALKDIRDLANECYDPVDKENDVCYCILEMAKEGLE